MRHQTPTTTQPVQHSDALAPLAEFPWPPGAPAGYDGQRFTVTRVRRDLSAVQLRDTAGIDRGWFPVSELHKPPPRSDAAQDRARELGAFLADPFAAVFGERE